MISKKLIVMSVILVITFLAGCILMNEKRKAEQAKELELYKTNFDAGPPNPLSEEKKLYCRTEFFHNIEQKESWFFTITEESKEAFIETKKPERFIKVTQNCVDLAANPEKLEAAVIQKIEAEPLSVSVLYFLSRQDLKIYSAKSNEEVVALSWSKDGKKLCFVVCEINFASQIFYHIYIWQWGDKTPKEICKFGSQERNEIRYKPQWDYSGEYIYVAGGSHEIYRVEVKDGNREVVCSGDAVVGLNRQTLILIRKSEWTPEESAVLPEMLLKNEKYRPFVFIARQLDSQEEKLIFRTASAGITFPLLSPCSRYICFKGSFQNSFSNPVKFFPEWCVFDVDKRCWFTNITWGNTVDWIEPNEAWLEALKKLPETSENNE